MDKADCEALRREIKATAEKVAVLYREWRVDWAGEPVANVMLAYRHLEDASMRLGKAIQALDGGVSVYDRIQVPGAGA
jgi:hypothetical protein